MLGKTHIAVGVAASFALLQPETLSSCVFTIAGGALGGLLPDFDQSDLEDKKGLFEGIVFLAVIIAVIIGIDYVTHLGFLDALTEGFGPLSIAGMAVFVATVIFGITTPHRSFTHSFVACALWVGSAYFACKNVCYSLAIGCLSHIILDLFNKRGLMLFFPIRKRMCFGCCASDGKANTVIGAVAILCAIILGSVMVAHALSTEDGLAMAANAENQFAGLTNFQWYLIGMNVATFFVCVLCALYFMFVSDDSLFGDILTNIINLMALAGGPFGMLIAALTTNVAAHKQDSDVDIIRRGNEGNSLLFVISISLCFFWAVVYIAATNAFGLSGKLGVDLNLINHLPLIVVLTIINTVSFVLFFKDRKNIRRKYHLSDLVLFFVALVGGAFGAMLAMSLTTSKQSQVHFSYGVPILLAVNVTSATLLVCNGIA